MKRKWLSMLLALCLVVGMIPVAASAEVVRVDDTESLWNDETQSFRIYDDYWADVVTSQPEGYVIDENAKSLSISTSEALAWFGKQINSGESFAGYTITITSDLDMSGHYWTPIDTATIQYNQNESGDVSWTTVDPQKKLDGATISGGEEGHTITGITTATGLRGPNQPSEPGDGSNCYYYAAFIGRNDGTLTISDLTFADSNIAITAPAEGVASNGSSMSAAVIANNSGTLTLDSVSVAGANILAMQKAAALVAYTTGRFTVRQCEITDNTISAYFQVAPVLGYGSKNNLVIQGIKLENNTVRALEQQGENWSYTTDEEGNQYYSYGSDATAIYNAGQVAVFYDGQTDSGEEGSGPELVAQVNGYFYGTLSNAIAAADPGDTVTVLRDATENVSVPSGKDIILDLNGKTLTSQVTVDGKLVVKDSTATAEPAVSADYEEVTYTSGKITYSGTTVLARNGGTVILESGTIQSTGNIGLYAQGDTTGASEVKSTVTMNGGYVIAQEFAASTQGKGATLNINDGVLVAKDNAVIAGNGTNKEGTRYGGTVINISGGTMIGHITTNGYIACGIYHPQEGELNITGGTIYADEGLGILMRGGKLNMTDGTITATANERTTGKVGDSTIVVGGSAVLYDLSSGYYDGENVTISLSGGNYTSASNVPVISVNAEEEKLVEAKSRISVTGGYFTSDPSEYVDENMAAIPSDLPGYAFTVGDAVETVVKPAVGAPSVELGSGISETDEQTVQNAAASVKVEGGELAAAANSIVTEADKVKEEAIQEYKESDIAGAGSATDVNVYAQTYLDIKPTAYNVTSENKTLTMDITPMYRVVASTEISADALKVEGEISADETANAVVLKGSEKELTNIQTMTITLTLPNGFTTKGSTVYIQHKGYEYTATADNSGKITFTNPHGFSEFTFSTQSQAVAKINGTSYTTLQAAVDAVKNGETITLLKNDLSATVSKAVTFKVDSEGGEYTATFTAGNGYVLTDDGNGNYVVTYAGGGGSATEEPTFPFEDVSESAWYYDAVKYVYENSIMAGTGDVTFDPEVKLTRAMAVQILYNLEGKPEVTTTSTFTDLDAGAWYIDAVNWASANGVVAGMGDNTFAPDVNVSREQFAQMMYNYATYKKYDVSKSGDLTQFPDNGSVSSWATTAMSWANGNGLINGTELSNGSVVLDPQGTAIRAQAASILMNFDKNLVK